MRSRRQRSCVALLSQIAKHRTPMDAKLPRDLRDRDAVGDGGDDVAAEIQLIGTHTTSRQILRSIRPSQR